MSSADALSAAACDADANAGSGDVGEPVSSCQADTPSVDSLWVRIDLSPAEAPNEPGSLRLEGSSGGYSRTIAIALDFEPNEDPYNTIDVLFENVPTNASYTLTYVGSDVQETVILQNVPYGSLQDSSRQSDGVGEAQS